jgi:hypothetical protein
MLNEFIFYAAISGAVSFGVIWAFLKDVGLGSIISAVLGVICIVFVFPEPESAKDLAGLANNISLIIIKIIWGLGWGAGIFGASLIAKQANP